MACTTPADAPLIGCCSGANYDVGVFLNTYTIGLHPWVSLPRFEDFTPATARYSDQRYRVMRSRSVKATGQTFDQVWDHGPMDAPTITYSETKSPDWDTSPFYSWDDHVINGSELRAVYRTKSGSGASALFGSVTITIEEPEPLDPFLAYSLALLTGLAYPDALANAQQQPITDGYRQILPYGPIALYVQGTEFSTPLKPYTLYDLQGAGSLGPGAYHFKLRLGKVKFKLAPQCIWTIWDESVLGTSKYTELGCSTEALAGNIIHSPTAAQLKSVFALAHPTSAIRIVNHPFPRYPWPGLVVPSCCPQFAFP